MGSLTFDLTSIEIKKLSKSDEKLKWLFNKVGAYTLSLKTDYFASLIRSIIGQQLSVKVARTIWDRFNIVCKEITPKNVLTVDDNILRDIGLSRAKINYVKDLAKKTLDGELAFNDINLMTNEEVIETLTKVKGIGKWTAEMFLIFSLGRLDILSLGDLGIKRAIKWLYNLNEVPESEKIMEYSKCWEPYRTVASLYLWEAVNRDYVKELKAVEKMII